MSSQHPQGQITEGHGRTAVHLDSRRETPIPHDLATPHPVDYDLINMDQKLSSMSSAISESRQILHASRSKIAASTKSNEQQLHAWYQAYEDLKAQHEATIAKLKQDNHSLTRQLEIAREYIKAREWEVRRMTEGHEIALKNAEGRAEIAQKKLSNLKKEKLQENRRVMAVAEALGGMAAPENGESGQDHRDSLVSSREQTSPGLDHGHQISKTKEFVQISPASSTKIISAPISRKRPRSDERDMDVQKQNCKTRREEGSEEIDEGTIVVEMREGSS